MFIGIAGPTASGKHTIARYLFEEHNYEFLVLNTRNEQESVFERESMYKTATRFNTAEEMQTYVTERWQQNFVTCTVEAHELWNFKKRPFFLFVSVDAPITIRYKRHTERCANQKREIIDINEFLIQDDRIKYNISIQDEGEVNSSTPLYNMMASSDIVITNRYLSKCELYQRLDAVELTNKERLRPSWDTYFMQLSDLAAQRSNCMKRRVGCILVKDSRVIATGYNGTPRGLRNCNEGGCARCNEGAPCGTGLDRCLCMHAEENALLEAGRGSVVYDNGVVLYCNTCPCLGCAIKIIQQGVKEVVYSLSYGMDQMTAKVFTEAKVKLRQHSPPSMRIELRKDIALEDHISLLEIK